MIINLQQKTVLKFLQGILFNNFSSNKAIIVNGNKLANGISLNLKQKITMLRQNKLIREPGLAVILVGHNPASISYVKKKLKACKKIGIQHELFHLKEDISQKELLYLIDFLNKREEIDSILTQLPLPPHINKIEVIQAIAKEKDVDCLQQMTNFQNIANFKIQDQRLLPCTPSACMHILDHYNVPLRGLRATILGRGCLVGYPLSSLLINRQASVTVLNQKSENISDHVRNADLIVAAAGCRHLVKGDWIAPGAIVLDVGVNRGIHGLDKKQLVGDVEFEEAVKRASLITPVPGGIGPMTVSMLLKNVVTAWEEFFINKFRQQYSANVMI